jgi:hypothetical protein
MEGRGAPIGDTEKLISPADFPREKQASMRRTTGRKENVGHTKMQVRITAPYPLDTPWSPLAPEPCTRWCGS